MTIQYDGNDQYKVWLSNGGWIILDKVDLISMQDLEFEGSKVNKLIEILDETVEKIEDAKEKIEDISDELIGIVDEKNFDAERFNIKIDQLCTILD